MTTRTNYSEKQLSILTAALKLFIAHGFHGTPTSKIAAEAGIAHGTLFHYFKTKDELVAALYGQIKANLREYLAIKIDKTATLQDRFQTLFTYSVQWSVENQDEFYFTQQFRYSPHVKMLNAVELVQQASSHRELYLEAVEKGVFKTLPVELISSLVMGQIIGTYEYLEKSKLKAKERQKIIAEASRLTWTMCIKN